MFSRCSVFYFQFSWTQAVSTVSALLLSRAAPSASLVAQTVKNPPAVQETGVWSLGWEDPLEKEMAAHSSILAQRIPWTEEPGRLQSMGSQESDTTGWLTLLFNVSSQVADFLSLLLGAAVCLGLLLPVCLPRRSPLQFPLHCTVNLPVLWDDASVLFSTDCLRGLNNNHRNSDSLSMSCVPGPFQSTLRALLLSVSLRGPMRWRRLSPHFERKK